MPTISNIDMCYINNMYSFSKDMAWYIKIYGDEDINVIGSADKIIEKLIKYCYDYEISDNYEMYIYCVKNKIYPLYTIDGEKEMLRSLKRNKNDILSLCKFYKSLIKITSISSIHNYENIKNKIKFFMDSGFLCVTGTFKIINFEDVLTEMESMNLERRMNMANSANLEILYV